MEGLINVYGVMLLASLRLVMVASVASAVASCAPTEEERLCEAEVRVIDMPLTSTDHQGPDCPPFERLTLEVVNPCSSPTIAVDGEAVPEWRCSYDAGSVTCEYEWNGEDVIASMRIDPESADAVAGHCRYHFGAP